MNRDRGADYKSNRAESTKPTPMKGYSAEI